LKTSRRTNAVLLTLLLACAADAQTPSERARPAPANTKNQSPARTTNQSHAPQAASPATKEARDAKTRERRERQSAAAALNEAAASASNAEDSYKRALILALAADALWFHDEQAARALFERAWDAAVASDKEETTAFESAAGAIPVGGASKDISDVPEEFNRLTRARQEVLAAASRHDSRLTERYIAELRESVKSLRGEDAAREDDRRRYDVRESLSEFDDEQTRLNLSRSLIEEGDYGQASEVAAPELAGGVSAALIRFLIQFHERAPTEADSLYGRLLARVAADPRADANDVLLLSSYVFTPSMLAAVDAGGSVNFGIVNGESGGRPVNDAPVAANVTRDFFNVAARVLLRPRPAARQHGETVALFFAITRLLPFFERGAPQLAPQLQARRQSLAAELDASSLDSLSSAAGRESLTPANPTDPLAADLEYSKRGPTSESRDAARQRIVMRAVKLKLWERARAAASEMEDAEARAGSSALIAVSQVASVADAFGDDEDGDERAARFVQNADVPPLARALGYARAALLASKRHRAARAGELLDMAQSFAEQTDSGTEARLVALLVVATTAEEFDPSRAWTAAPAIVQAANEVRDAEPDELSGGFRLPQLDGAEGVGLGEELADFRLDTFFASLAARDFPRALKGARSLSDATTRSLVIIAASRARLAASVAHAPEPERAR
jgi:hypothetical protein